MKKNFSIAMMAAMMAVCGGASAMEFGELQGKTAASLKVPAAEEKGYVVDPSVSVTIEPQIKHPEVPVEWVTIPGGRFSMGTMDFQNATPVHEVNISAFQMSKTLVTVEQYAECVSARQCLPPDVRKLPACNWGRSGREKDPVNCVNWRQAKDYARFAGARLPSEAEWEYAATSGGRNQKYPWGNALPTPDVVVMKRGSKATMPVCSRPLGNTAQGLCDMTGNLRQWVEDSFVDSYRGVPVDGSALVLWAPGKSIRGWYFNNPWPNAPLEILLRSDSRSADLADSSSLTIGFRLAR